MKMQFTQLIIVWRNVWKFYKNNFCSFGNKICKASDVNGSLIFHFPAPECIVLHIICAWKLIFNYNEHTVLFNWPDIPMQCFLDRKLIDFWKHLTALYLIWNLLIVTEEEKYRYWMQRDWPVDTSDCTRRTLR